MNPATVVCNYALLRFVPYPERGEEVNVGVLVNCQNPALLAFRGETAMPERVRAMFPRKEPEDFAVQMEWMRKEVERVRAVVATDPERARLAFGELVRRRESVLRFGEAKTILTGHPEGLAEELFGRYVRMEELPAGLQRKAG